MKRFDCPDAEGLARRHFDVVGTATELGGERTQNFRIRTVEGKAFTLKVSDPNEDVAIAILENAALMHLERTAPDIVVPRVVKAREGGDVVQSDPQDKRYLRLLTYLPGTPLAAVKHPSTALRRNIGREVARLDLGLSSFSHPHASERELIWDVKRIGGVKPLLSLLEGDRRRLAETMLARFETIAGPAVSRLPSQVVHSDMNGQNMLVDASDESRLAGFLDFGDLVHAPRIVDLAGAALLQFDHPGDGLQGVADVVMAYHESAPLQELEFDLLPEMMIARCVINVTVTEWLASRDPSNRAYIMKNNPASWARLERISALPPAAFREAFAAQYESCLP